MQKLVVRNIIRFLILMCMQLLVLNNIYMGSYVMPELYLLFILMLPTSIKRIPLLLVAFFTGLCIDVANNALGFHALACTVVAFARFWFADRILTRGEPVVINTPSMRSVNPQHYLAYLVLLYALFFTVLYLSEMFSFRGFGDVLLSIIASSVVSSILVVLYQLLFIRVEK
ncbi:MAG: hypothetical protein IJ761_01575 [Bacteroidales bacterium]|nr:hypothetical protein [Bacteroidales bacterium]